jgi:hypothetical protein
VVSAFAGEAEKLRDELRQHRVPFTETDVDAIIVIGGKLLPEMFLILAPKIRLSQKESIKVFLTTHFSSGRSSFGALRSRSSR